MIDKFAGGSESARDKLNKIVDVANAMSAMSGDGVISIQRSPSGVAVRLNANVLASKLPKIAKAHFFGRITEDLTGGQYTFEEVSASNAPAAVEGWVATSSGRTGTMIELSLTESLPLSTVVVVYDVVNETSGDTSYYFHGGGEGVYFGKVQDSVVEGFNTCTVHRCDRAGTVTDTTNITCTLWRGEATNEQLLPILAHAKVDDVLAITRPVDIDNQGNWQCDAIDVATTFGTGDHSANAVSTLTWDGFALVADYADPPASPATTVCYGVDENDTRGWFGIPPEGDTDGQVSWWNETDGGYWDLSSAPTERGCGYWWDGDTVNIFWPPLDLEGNRISGFAAYTSLTDSPTYVTADAADLAAAPYIDSSGLPAMSHATGYPTLWHYDATADAMVFLDAPSYGTVGFAVCKNTDATPVVSWESTAYLKSVVPSVTVSTGAIDYLAVVPEAGSDPTDTYAIPFWDASTETWTHFKPFSYMGISDVMGLMVFDVSVGWYTMAPASDGDILFGSQGAWAAREAPASGDGIFTFRSLNSEPYWDQPTIGAAAFLGFNSAQELEYATPGTGTHAAIPYMTAAGGLTVVEFSGSTPQLVFYDGADGVTVLDMPTNEGHTGPAILTWDAGNQALGVIPNPGSGGDQQYVKWDDTGNNWTHSDAQYAPEEEV